MTLLQSIDAQARADAKIDPSTPWKDLSWDEKQRYLQRQAELILINQSALPSHTVEVAQSVLNTGIVPAPESLGIGEATSIFFGEMANQAQEINPLSDRNRGSFSWWLMLTITIGVIVYLAGVSGLAKDVIDAKK